MAKEVTIGIRAEQLKDEEIILIGVMTGALIFLGDIMRELGDEGLHSKVDTMDVHSYGDKTTSNEDPEVIYRPKHNLENKHLVIVEDILDTLHTIKKIVEVLREYHPASITIVALLAKDGAAKIPMPEGLRQILVGFEIPAHYWVHGYGIDTEEFFRWLREIQVVMVGVTEEEVTEFLDKKRSVIKS